MKAHSLRDPECMTIIGVPARKRMHELIDVLKSTLVPMAANVAWNFAVLILHTLPYSKSEPLHGGPARVGLCDLPSSSHIWLVGKPLSTKEVFPAPSWQQIPTNYQYNVQSYLTIIAHTLANLIKSLRTIQKIQG
jgi:hypothetical protein